MSVMFLACDHINHQTDDIVKSDSLHRAFFAHVHIRHWSDTNCLQSQASPTEGANTAVKSSYPSKSMQTSRCQRLFIPLRYLEPRLSHSCYNLVKSAGKKNPKKQTNMNSSQHYTFFFISLKQILLPSVICPSTWMNVAYGAKPERVCECVTWLLNYSIPKINEKRQPRPAQQRGQLTPRQVLQWLVLVKQVTNKDSDWAST